MSNTPEPCTCLRAIPFPLLKHLSLALAEHEGQVGRRGPTICGRPGAIDQQRLTNLIWQRRPHVKIHELRPCVPCHSFLRR